MPCIRQDVWGQGWRDAGTLCSGHQGWSLQSSHPSMWEDRCHVPGSVLGSSQKSPYLILTRNLQNRCSYCPVIEVNKPRLRQGQSQSSSKPRSGSARVPCFKLWDSIVLLRFGAKMLPLGLKIPFGVFPETVIKEQWISCLPNNFCLSDDTVKTKPKPQRQSHHILQKPCFPLNSVSEIREACFPGRRLGRLGFSGGQGAPELWIDGFLLGLDSYIQIFLSIFLPYGEVDYGTWWFNLCNL